jgi:hypothetical protein
MRYLDGRIENRSNRAEDLFAVLMVFDRTDVAELAHYVSSSHPFSTPYFPKGVPRILRRPHLDVGGLPYSNELQVVFSPHHIR